MALLYSVSAQSDVGSIPGNIDKLLHAVAYVGLGLLSMRAFHGGLKPLALLPVILGLLLTAAYGGLDEWHQSRVPGRDANEMDWLADLVGAGLCIPLFMLWRRLRVRWVSDARHD
jgi:VanZ family protein